MHNSFPFHLRLTSRVKKTPPNCFFRTKVRGSSFFPSINWGLKTPSRGVEPPNLPSKSDPAPAPHFALYFNPFLAFSLLYYTVYYAHFLLSHFFLSSTNTFHTFSHNTEAWRLIEGELRGSGSRTVGVKNRPPQPSFKILTVGVTYPNCGGRTPTTPAANRTLRIIDYYLHVYKILLVVTNMQLWHKCIPTVGHIILHKSVLH